MDKVNEGNKKQSQVVVKGTLSFKQSDGSEMTLGFVMPYVIASKIAIDIMNWKEKWLWTAKEYEEYQELEKQFLSESK